MTTEHRVGPELRELQGLNEPGAGAGQGQEGRFDGVKELGGILGGAGPMGLGAVAIFALPVAGRCFLGPVCHNIIGQPVHSRACEEYRASQGLR